MGEVLAIGASVIAIVQITDRIVGLCKFYIETVNDAPSDFRLILLETSALKTIFESLSFLKACDSSVLNILSGLASVDGPIEGCLKSVTQLEKLFPSNWQKITEQCRSKKRKVKVTLAALAWPLKEGKARKLLDEISRYKTSITLALTTESGQDIKEIKAKTADIHGLLTESQREEIYRWLQRIDPSSLHLRAKKDYMPGTGSWILRTPEWSSWLSANERCLWIHGIPGAGKTVLMSYLIQHLKQHCSNSRTRKCAIVYYYCYFGHNQNEAAPFLRWLLNQLCRQADSTPRYIYRLYKECGEPDLEELLIAVGEVLEEFDCTYLVIDALDESIPRNDLLQVLRALATDPRFQKVQLLASSREYIDIEEAMGEFSIPVSMANPCVEEDIRLHVRASLKSNYKFKRWPQELLDEVEDALSKGAQGMFRWAVCQIDVLQRLKCERRVVEKALKNLPKTLDETYNVILLAMPQEDLVVVNHILHWISYHNELHYGEGIPCEILIQAVGKSTAELTVDGLERFYDNDTLRELCGCLIKIVPEEQVYKYGNFPGTALTASFAHYTVREYLDSNRSRNSMVSSTIRQKGLRQKFLGAIISEAQHLESNELSEHENGSINHHDALDVLNRSLGVYSVLSAILSLCKWPTEISQHETLCTMAIELLNPSKPHFEYLERAASVIEAFLGLFSKNGLDLGSQFCRMRWYPQTSSKVAVRLIHLLLLAEDVGKCLPLVEKFLQAKDSTDFLQARLRFRMQVRGVISDDCAECYLLDGSIIEVYAQLTNPDALTFKLLLDHGAGLFNCSKILLLHVAFHEHKPEYGCRGECLFRRLLKLGADLNSRNSRITPLQIAVISGDLDGVSLLLDAGADPNGTGSSEGTVWEDGTPMSHFNHLHGASALHICRNLGYYIERGHLKPRREDHLERIEETLLRYGAQTFLRA